jgi:subtilase family serine protease
MSFRRLASWLFGSASSAYRRHFGSHRRPAIHPIDAFVQPLEARLLLAADLRPTFVDVPSNAARGSTISVNTAVANGGDSPTGTYTIRYYASSDATITSGDTLLKSVTRSGQNAGAVLQWSEAVTIPVGMAAGNYYIGVIVDATNAVVESNETNNWRADSATIQITAPPNIDLRAMLVDGPAAADGGTNIAVTTAVRNQGTADSGSYTVWYYISTDANITTSDLRVKAVTRPALGGGAQQQWAESITVPANLATGNYYLGVVVDPLNTLTETAENNNVLAEPTAIRITQPSLIDLTVTNVDGPTTNIRGTPMSVVSNVSNLGSAASGNFTVSYYLSADATINTADRLLKTVTRTSINANSNQQWTESITLPSAVAAGTYYIGMIVDPANSIRERIETNNWRADTATVAVSVPPSIDFLPTLVDGPGAADGGAMVSVSTSVRNQGTTNAASYGIAYYLSTDAAITTADLRLKTVTRPALDAAGLQQWVESVAIPTTLATGNYYIGVIVDPTNSVAEISESNNILGESTSIRVTQPSQIDLTPTSVDGPTAAQRGNSVAVVTNISNAGSAASGSFNVNYYISTDAAISTGDTLLKSVNRAAIVGAGNVQWTETVTIPSTLAAGTYYIGVVVDPGNAIRERNEANNTRADSAAITITAPASPPPSSPGGSQFTISMTFSGLTSTQIAIFNQAAARWSQIITGDLPDVVYNGATIDDVTISASSAAIDGAGGILGQAGPTRLRLNSYLPYMGNMQFDSADLAQMESNGTLLPVIIHEMGHVLGIGTIWSYKGLISGAGGAAPIFTGPQATAAYNQIFGTNASGVPVEGNNSPAGSRDAHWRESVFRTELMTPYISGTSNPISRVTVASLADLGYTVSMSAADAYVPPSSVVVGDTAAGISGSPSLVWGRPWTNANPDDSSANDWLSRGVPPRVDWRALSNGEVSHNHGQPGSPPQEHDHTHDEMSETEIVVDFGDDPTIGSIPTPAAAGLPNLDSVFAQFEPGSLGLLM